MWIAPVIYFVVSVILWQFAGAVYVPELLSNRLFEILPVGFIEWGVQLLGPIAKKLALANMTLLYFGLYWLFSQNWGRLRKHFESPFYAAFALWAANELIIFPLAGAGMFGERLPQGPVSASVFLFAAHWIFGRS